MVNSIYKTHKTGTNFGNFQHFINYPNSSNDIGPLWVLFSSFSLGLVADGGSHLTVDVLFLAVDNEEQRRVHSYTSKVKQLPERGNTIVRPFRKTNIRLFYF